MLMNGWHAVENRLRKNPMSGNKWLTYQRERFPVIAHGVLIAAFSLSAVSFSTLLRGGKMPMFEGAITAFITSFIFFLQLRIADEFKDFEEDSKYRPYRPVPRGLVTLRELGIVFAIGAAIQLTLGLILELRLLALLLITWAYLTGMTKEFWIRNWLKSHPLIYMVSHMAIMPLIDLYATACDWTSHQAFPPDGLFWFLIASLFNGMVIEIGRKIRAPQDEETGVQTYTFLWGRTGAIGAWLLVVGLTLAAALSAASKIHFLPPATVILGLMFAGAITFGLVYLKNPVTRNAKMVETYAGLWSLSLYLTLGIIPLAAQNLG